MRWAPNHAGRRKLTRRVLHGLALMLLPAAIGCTGVQPAPGPANQTATTPAASGPSDAVYLGWRVFQGNCARCHGPDAAGTDQAPNLLERVKPMSEPRFIAAVLERYRWVLPSSEAATESGAREALIDSIIERRQGAITMPAWAGEPGVQAHVADLYAYLQARAQGRLAVGRP